jgi:hypothetical protein
LSSKSGILNLKKFHWKLPLYFGKICLLATPLPLFGEYSQVISSEVNRILERLAKNSKLENTILKDPCFLFFTSGIRGLPPLSLLCSSQFRLL